MTTEAISGAAAADDVQFSRRKTILFAVTAIVLFFLIVEGICAIIWATIVPDRFKDQEGVTDQFEMDNFLGIVEKDPWLFWQLKANKEAPSDRGKMCGFIASGDHMRNPDVPVERGSNDLRVLCLGDSITFGWGVRYEEAYPTVLADMLREALPGRSIHVLNAACSGYTAHQGWEMLRRRGLKYRPDVVTLWFGWNDSSDWGGMTDAEHAKLFIRDHWLAYSATYRVISYVLRRMHHKKVKKERKKAGRRKPRMPLDDYKGRLRDMIALARGNETVAGTGRGAKVVLIQGAYCSQLHEARKKKGRFARDDYQKAMAEVAKELDVPMLPILPTLYKAGLKPDVFMDKGHLDGRGLRVVADALFAFMAKHRMLPETATTASTQPGAP